MKSNSFISRILVTTLALGVGLGVFFFGHQLTWVEAIDTAAAASAKSPERVIHEHNRITGTITARPFVKTNDAGKTFQHVLVTDDPERIFETCPPSALDYAVILESLHNRGYRHINLATRLSWDHAPGLLIRGLDLRLGLFKSSIIPIAVTRGPKDADMPEMLKHSLISHSQIHGNTTRVPLVNRLALSPHITGNAEGVLAGFHHIESNPPTEGQIAMLARWANKGMIPSYELLTIMQAHRVSPGQLVIQCGKHIRLGKNGPVIPIDTYGQTPIPHLTKAPPSPTPVHADTLITRKKSDITLTPIVIIHAQGARVSSTNILGETRLKQALQLTHAFPHPGKGTPYHRLPIWAELIILSNAVIIFFLLKGTSRANQHLGFALSIALTMLLLYAFLNITHHWVAISPLLAIWLTGWISPYSQRRSTSAMPEYHTTDTKPVIRA